MLTFEAQLDPVNWTEILEGGTYLAFDILAAKEVEIYFSETGATPATSAKGAKVAAWPRSWDYEGLGFRAGVQRVWARGATDISGVRA